MRSWLYVGHQSQVPGRGDYFLFEIAGESVIVIRNAEGGINAMMNVCRHRGSRICDQPTGHESRLVCRYHGWTYGLDGGLRAAGHMPEGFDRSQLGLRRLHTRVFMGLIFVSFADEPPAFEAIERRSRRAAPALWSRPCEGRSPPELSDHLELEACDRKLLRVLSLRTGAPRILGSAWTGGPAGAVGSHAGGGHAARTRGRAHATHDPQVVARIRRPGRRPGLRPVPAAPRPSHRQPGRQARGAAARDRSRVTTAARRTCISAR